MITTRKINGFTINVWGVKCGSLAGQTLYDMQVYRKGRMIGGATGFSSVEEALEDAKENFVAVKATDNK